MSFGSYNPALINSLPPAVLKALPAGQPPPGIEPNFADPPTTVPVILGVDIALLVLAVLCISIRIYTKLVIAKSWKWDDLTCSLGFLCSIVYFVAIVMGCVYGGVGRHMWDVYLYRLVNKNSLYQGYIPGIMVTPALGLIKSSFFIQYYLLFRTLRWIKISVWIGATVSTLFYISVTITAFALASPWPGESLLDCILSSHFDEFTKLSIPTGVMGTLVDWYLLILPIPAVMGLQLSTPRKLGVLAVFMTGSLGATASVVSLYYRVQLQQDPTDDPLWKGGYVLLWAQVEMFAGVAASSMPAVNQFFTHYNLSPRSWTLPLKASVTRLLSSSTREKLSDNGSSFTNRSGNNTQNSGQQEEGKVKDLESNGANYRAAKTPGVLQILTTRIISITEAQLDNVSRPATIATR